MNDNSKMSFGKYKGIEMANVPPDYLIWLYDNCKVYGEIKDYIKDNMDVLKAEIAYELKKNK